MGGNSDHQCIVDPAGGVQPKYIGESEGISFLLDFVSVFSGIVGLFISYYTNVATGPMIVIIASVIFFATYFYGRNR